MPGTARWVQAVFGTKRTATFCSEPTGSSHCWQGKTSAPDTELNVELREFLVTNESAKRAPRVPAIAPLAGVHRAELESQRGLASRSPSQLTAERVTGVPIQEVEEGALSENAEDTAANHLSLATDDPTRLEDSRFVMGSDYLADASHLP